MKYLVLIFSLIFYASVFVPPEAIPGAVVVAYMIPAVVLFNIFFFFVFLIWKRRSSLIPFVSLIAGIPFIVSSVQWSAPSSPTSDSFTVLAFNAKLFRKAGTYRQFSTDMIEWTVRDSSDIKIISEYSTDSRWPLLDVNKKMRTAGYNVYNVAAPIRYNEHNLGAAIITRLPVASRGIVYSEKKSVSLAIFEDIVKGKDTLRVYCVHLASMDLNVERKRSIVDALRHVSRKLIDGALRRSAQLDIVLAHVDTSPYPYMVCGDFNETPYSYNYWRLRRHMSDAFVAEGSGFGLTFHSLRPFVRIDYQFCSDGVSVEDAIVDESMKISDHLPVRGRYSISE